MEVGDILYFIDMNTGKLSKHKVKEIILPCTDDKRAGVTFTNFLYKSDEQFTRIHSVSLKDRIGLTTIFYRTNKEYLIFDNAEAAAQTLIDVILVRKIEIKKIQSDTLREKYFESFQEVEKAELELKKFKESFDKKCNALKKKFV